MLAYCQDDEEYLPQSAESILNQNFADVVLHLVADGFDPGPYARQISTEPNVRLYRNDESVGPYVSAMRVWDRMETSFFAVQDADDISLPDRIWDAVTTLEREKGDLFGACLIHFLDRHRQDDVLANKLAYHPYHRSGVVWSTAPLGMCLNPTLVVRRRAFEKINGFAGWKCSGDCEFNTRARHAGLKAICSPHLHGLRRLQNRSLSNGPEYGMGTPGRDEEIAKGQANYEALKAGASPRSLGTLDKHRSGIGTLRLDEQPEPKPTIGPKQQSPLRVPETTPADVPLFWIKWLRNFGDALSPAIVAHLAGTPVRWMPMGSTEPFYTCIGSFLRHELSDHATVWGTGIITADAVPNPRCRYAMVRGPITAAAVRRAGGECPEIFGDPGMLIPRLIPMEPKPEHEWGVVLHHRELPEVERLIATDSVKLIRIDTTDLKGFVEQLVSCERVLSSSLHGLIAAHAFGLPAAWISPTTIPLGDGTKFTDYLLSVGLPPVPVSGDVIDVALLSRAEHSLRIVRHDVESMLRVCPFT